MALALGAPLGWLCVRWRAGSPPVEELTLHPDLYLYLLLPTMAVFGIFGRLLGAREEHLRRLVVQLDEQSTTDPLTGLRNRRYFLGRVQEACERRSRAGTPFVLAILDLDNFKVLNDRFGHLAGDRVLAEVGRTLASSVRRSELVTRIGGEEFGLLFPSGDEAQATRALERILRQLCADVASAAELPRDVTVTASAGAACSTSLGSTVDLTRMMAAADQALYRAKALGRNRSELWSEPAVTTAKDEPVVAAPTV